MIRVVVADDEPPARQRILDILAGDPEMEIVGAYGDGPATIAGVLEMRPDLVFLDIRMPRISGLDVAAALPLAHRPGFIFVTAFSDHAADAFNVEAVDYVLKPFDDHRFTLALDRGREYLRLRKLDRIASELVGAVRPAAAPASSEIAARLERFVVEEKQGMRIVAVTDIDYIRARGPYAILHAGTARYVVREPIKRIEAGLDPTEFFRIHRSTIVRLDRVHAILPTWRGEHIVQLKDKTELRLSRNRRSMLLHALR